MHVCKQRFGLDLQTELRCDSHSFKSLRYENCPADVEHVLCQACSICDSQWCWDSQGTPSQSASALRHLSASNSTWHISAIIFWGLPSAWHLQQWSVRNETLHTDPTIAVMHTGMESYTLEHNRFRDCLKPFNNTYHRTEWGEGWYQQKQMNALMLYSSACNMHLWSMQRDSLCFASLGHIGTWQTGIMTAHVWPASVSCQQNCNSRLFSPHMEPRWAMPSSVTPWLPCKFCHNLSSNDVLKLQT